MQNYTKALALAIALIGIIIVAPRAGSDTITTTTTTTTTTVVKIIREVPQNPVIPAATMAKWEKVNICETGGNWRTRGPIYSGGLGIMETNWMKYGGWEFGAEYTATPEAQVLIAERIQAASGLTGYVPDQNGCGHGW